MVIYEHTSLHKHKVILAHQTELNAKPTVAVVSNIQPNQTVIDQAKHESIDKKLEDIDGQVQPLQFGIALSLPAIIILLIIILLSIVE